MEYIPLPYLDNPEGWIASFKSDKEFTMWCMLGTIDELVELRDVYEDHELFEYCKIIQDCIDMKCDRILTKIQTNYNGEIP